MLTRPTLQIPCGLFHWLCRWSSHCYCTSAWSPELSTPWDPFGREMPLIPAHALNVCAIYRSEKFLTWCRAKVRRCPSSSSTCYSNSRTLMWTSGCGYQRSASPLPSSFGAKLSSILTQVGVSPSRTIGLGMKGGTGVWKCYHTVAQMGIKM